MAELTLAEFKELEQARTVQGYNDLLEALKADGSIVISDFPESEADEDEPVLEPFDPSGLVSTDG